MDRLNEVMRNWSVDIEAQHYIRKACEAELDAKAEELAAEKAEIKLSENKEQYQLEVLKQFQEDGIKKEAMKLSSASPLISDTYNLNGYEFFTDEFIPDSVVTDPIYENNILVKNQYSLEYQEVNNKTGKRSFVWKETVTFVLICNPISVGKCEDILVFLKGKKTPFRFRNGEITEEAFHRQTTFARKGRNVSVSKQFECFLRDLRECPNKKFLTIPKHAGGVTLPNGVTTYISADSVIVDFEELFPMEVRGHKMVAHPLSLEDTAAIYHKALPNCLEANLATTVRVGSLLLPLFEAEGLHPDRVFSFSYTNDAVREAIIALTKRKNYTSTVVQALTAHITNVRKELESANDITVLFTYSGIFEEGHKLDNSFKECMWDITGQNGLDDKTRKIIVFITDTPERIPDEYPVYYINCSEDIVPKNVPVLQRLSGMNDYSFKEFIYNNPDTARHLVRDGIKAARHIVSNFKNVEITDTMLMTLATAHILKRHGVVTGSDLRGIIRWFRTKATSRSTMTDAICREFKSAVSGAILSGELKIAKQFGPPCYSDDGNTAFIREEDKSINMNDDAINNVIISKISTRSAVKMNKHLKEKGLLKGKHTNKRKLKVAYDAGVLEDTEVFSYSRSVLNVEAKAYVDDIINNEYWFNVGEYPDGFVPVLYNVDGTRVAGYVFNPDMDENLHEVYFGATRSGKTFALVNRAVEKVVVEGADVVLIFDQTGGFTPTEIDKHIGEELRETYCSFCNVYEDGLPVDLLDLRGCLSYKDKKDRLLRIYTMMSRTLGSYEEQILKNVIKRMLRDMKMNPNMTIFDISKYICKDIQEDESPAKGDTHRKLLYKIDTVLDDLRGTPNTKNNWGEFAKAQDKPIIVISTGADGAGKVSEIVDILLESLYGYKQCHPYEKYTVVIDEAQDLYLHEKGAVNTLLRKGGKHGVTMLLASQSYPDPTTPFGKVVGNCGRVRGYRSKGDDIARYADRFSCDKHEADSLQKGHCFDNGLFYSRYRKENVIKTLKGKTIEFEPASNINC
ncbi:MAG TPA: hypothetical protein P5092_15240 [Ruminococcus sp.]|nr:hypothetical protein [Ruminococcus sp.]